MNHPNREEWIAFLYEEIEGAEKEKFGAHLKECDVCRHSVERWQQAMGALDAWKLPKSKPRRKSPALRPFIQWAAAAAILLTCGILIGQANRPQKDLTARLAKAEAEVAETRAMLAELSTNVADDRRRSDVALVKALEKLEARHANELRAMRKDLETVATLTEVGFRSAQNQIVRLAGYSGHPTQ
jgi:hypothetical protein